MDDQFHTVPTRGEWSAQQADALIGMRGQRKQSQIIDSPSAGGVTHKLSMETGPANPRNMAKQSMNIDSPSALDRRPAHKNDLSNLPRVAARGSIDKGDRSGDRISVALIADKKYSSSTSGGMKVGRQKDDKLRLDIPLNVSKKQVREAISVLKGGGNAEVESGRAPSHYDGPVSAPMLDEASKCPRILIGLDLDRFPLPVGSAVGNGEEEEGALVATVRFVDGEWTSGWETPAATLGGMVEADLVTGIELAYDESTYTTYLQARKKRYLVIPVVVDEATGSNEVLPPDRIGTHDCPAPAEE